MYTNNIIMYIIKLKKENLNKIINYYIIRSKAIFDCIPDTNTIYINSYLNKLNINLK